MIEKKIHFPSDIFFFSLYGVYAITLAPKIVSLLKFGEKNIWVGIMGITIYILEIFAYKFKLHVIRFDSERKRAELSKYFDTPLRIPKAGIVIWFGVFLKSSFRVGLVIISLLSFGISFGHGHEMSGLGLTFLLISFLLEAFLFFYYYFYSPFFIPYPLSKKEIVIQINESNKWLEAASHKYNSVKYFRLEFLSDIVLNLFAFMLYTAWWDYINDYGIKVIEASGVNFVSASATASKLCPMLIAESLVAIMPLRIAYWIKGMAISYSSNEKWKLGLSFLFAVLMTLSPIITRFIDIYFPR